MPEEPTGNEDDTNSGDLPDPRSGKSHSDMEDLVERLREDVSETAPGEQPEGDGEEGQSPEADSGESDGSEGGSQSDSSQGSDTVRMTFHVDRETAERLRNAVYWTGAFVTLSGTARDALRAAVRQLEEQYNDGEPFPERGEDLKGGNPNLK